MGRWGFRLFEGDCDLDVRDDIASLIVSLLKDEEAGPMILNTPEKREVGDKIIKDADDEDSEIGSGLYLQELIQQGDPVVRKILRGRVCHTLFDLTRGDNRSEIIVGAMMMQAGVSLRAKDKRRLRRIIPAYSYGYTELSEEGFENPAQAQVSAALDHHRAGTSRDFSAPSCDNCGKIEADTGSQLLECDRCLQAWWCNEGCKTANAEKHAGEGACMHIAGV